MPAIEMVLSLSDLVDCAYCETVSDELHKNGRRWEVRKATPELWEQLPVKSGLYMFVLVPNLMLRRAHPERADKLQYALYVGKAGSRPGQTSSLRSRYKADYRHYLGQDPDLLWSRVAPPRRREDVLRKYLNLYPLEYWYLEIPETETIDRMEKSLIKLLNPPLNSQGKTKLRPIGKAVPAFTQGH
jgi:hypothetical protein